MSLLSRYTGRSRARLYAPGPLRRRMLLLAGALMVLSLVAALLGDGERADGVTVVRWTLSGAAVAVLGVAMALRAPRDECAFCGTPRTGVTFLVTGPAVSICDECASLPLSIVAEEYGRRKQDWHRRFLEALPRPCPTRISRPLLEAMAASDASAPGLRETARLCLQLQNDDLACELLLRVPEAERQTADLLDLGLAYGRCGCHGEALAATERALARDDGSLRALCLNNRTWFRRWALPDAPLAERTAWLADLDEARRLLAEQKPAGWERLVQSCHGTEAELRRSLGDQDGALQALAAAEALGPHAAERLLVRARVRHAAGLNLEARADAESVLDLAHPESPEARAATELLASLPA